MDWLGPCRHLQVGRVLNNDDKCVTVPFSIIRTTDLPFRLVDCAPPVKLHAFSVGLLSSTYELRFPHGSREREPCLRLLYFPSPVLPFAPHIHALAHFYFSHEPHNPKKLPSTKFPFTHSCLGIYPTQHSFMKHHPHSFCLHFFTIPVNAFFPPVIIM